MKNASFRQKLLTSFLAIGILPLLICTLLMLNIFRLSLTRSAADAAETQLDAMSGELSGLLSDCETVMEKLCAEPAVAAALDRSELDEQRVYSVLYRAAAPVLGGASLSVYGADGRQLYSTVRICVILALLCTVIGVVLMFALCAISAFDSATVGNLLVYMGLWLLPVILLNFSLKR